MEQLKQEHRKELLDLKQKYDLEKMDRKNSTPAEAQEVPNGTGQVPNGMVEAGSIDMLKLLEEMDSQDNVEVVEEDA